MIAICEILAAQGRTASDLARLTGLAEKQILELMETRQFPHPSCFYMKVADALGVSVEELLRNDSEFGEEETPKDGMCWEGRFERMPDTVCRIYLAKITGPHIEYRFDRVFRRVSYRYSRDDICCTTRNLEDGVYEVCARWYDEQTGEMVHCRRSWFAVCKGVSSELEERDVLCALFHVDKERQACTMS